MSDRQSFAEASRDLLRERLFDAAAELLRTRTWRELTMADVAVGAGVSRQTLYNEFGSRPEFAQAYVLREADLFTAAVEDAIADHPDDARGALAAAFDLFLSAAETDPLIRAIASGEGSDELLALVTIAGGPVLERATERLGALLVSGWPRLAAGDARVVAEAVVRLAISHAALPSGPVALSAAHVGELLGPYLDELLARRPERRAA